MKTKIISCQIFKPIIEKYDLSLYDVSYLDIAQHEDPNKLRKEIQDCIDNINCNQYDQIVLMYGLCGNALDGIINTQNIDIIIPRFHDCFAIFMGSYERYIEVTNNIFTFEYETKEYKIKKVDFSCYEDLDEDEIMYLNEVYKNNSLKYYVKYDFDENIDETKYDKIIEGKYDIFDCLFNNLIEDDKFIKLKYNEILNSNYDLKKVFKKK